MDVNKLLRDYAWNVTQLGLLRAETGYIELSAQVLTDMPKGSDVTSQVERTISKAYWNLMELRKEIADISGQIEQAEQLIRSRVLTNDERIVLEKKYIDSLSWKDIQEYYENEKNYSPNIKTLQRYNEKGIKKLQRFINEKMPK